MALVLEVRHLALIQEISETGSVTKAAERLHLTQSALSHQLRTLEEVLGLDLFLRLGKRMVITPAGERVLASSRRVLDELRRTEEDLKIMAEDGSGILRLCTECNTGYHWLPPLLEQYRRAHPGIEVQIAVDATRRPIGALLDGEIDLAIVTSVVDDRRLLVSPLFHDELVAVVSPQHPLAKRARLEPADFAGEHLILYTADREDSYAFKRILMPAGVEPARVSAVPLTEAILEMVRAGLGISVMARWAIEPAIRGGEVCAIRITRRGIYRAWSAATRREPPEPRWLRAFIELLAGQSWPARLDPAARPARGSGSAPRRPRLIHPLLASG